MEKVLPCERRGWVTADTHVHFLSPATALLEGAAEGVNVINLLASQWGELVTNAGDFDGRTTWGSPEAGGDGEYLVRVGTENRQHVLGHISLLGYGGSMITPLTTGGTDEAALGDPVEVLLTEWARQCKLQGGLVVIPHFPNPRAEHAATLVSGDADAIEMTSWSDFCAGIDPYSLSDWYRYLNCGYMVPAVGGTDKMSASMAVGTVRTYAISTRRTLHLCGVDGCHPPRRDLCDLRAAAGVRRQWPPCRQPGCHGGGRRYGGCAVAGGQRHRAHVACRADRQRGDPQPECDRE